MRKPVEMYTVSRMQNVVQIRKKNVYFVTNSLVRQFWKSSLGALGVESPRGVAIIFIAVARLMLYSILVWVIFENN